MNIKLDGIKKEVKEMTKCECGRRLDYTVSPYITIEKRVCPNCGRIHYVEIAPIRWDVANGRKEQGNEGN